jgi:hypothetical protein
MDRTHLQLYAEQRFGRKYRVTGTREVTEDQTVCTS